MTLKHGFILRNKYDLENIDQDDPRYLHCEQSLVKLQEINSCAHLYTLSYISPWVKPEGQ